MVCIVHISGCGSLTRIIGGLSMVHIIICPIDCFKRKANFALGHFRVRGVTVIVTREIVIKLLI